MLTIGNQLKAARALLGVDQEDVALRAGLNVNTIRNMEAAGAGPIAGRSTNVQLVQRLLEDDGLEFLNHGQPGVRLRANVLRDGGKGAFPIDPNAIFTAFGALDGARIVQVLVQDLVLDRIAGGVAHVEAVERYRKRLLLIANSKYQKGLSENGVVKVLYVDCGDFEGFVEPSE